VLVGAALFLGGGYWLATRGDRGPEPGPSSTGVGAGTRGADAAATGELAMMSSATAAVPLARPPVWSSDVSADAGLGTNELHGLARFANVTRAVGAKGTILVRAATGGWAREASGTDANLASIAMRDRFSVAVGAQGTALHAAGADGKWTASKTGTKEDLTGVAVVKAGASEAFAVGARGTLLHESAPGQSWTVETSPVAVDFAGVWASDDGALVLAVGKGGAVVRRDARGTWRVEPSGTNEDLLAIAGEMQSVRAVGAHGTVIQRNGEGSSGDAAAGAWVLVSPPAAEGPAASADLYGVAVRAGTIHAVGAHGATLRYGSRGWQIDRSGTDSDLFCVLADPALIVAAGAGGIVMKRAQ
jgi:hypothetical protein